MMAMSAVAPPPINASVVRSDSVGDRAWRRLHAGLKLAAPHDLDVVPNPLGKHRPRAAWSRSRQSSVRPRQGCARFRKLASKPSFSGMALLEEADRFGEKVLARQQGRVEGAQRTWSTLFDCDISTIESA